MSAPPEIIQIVERFDAEFNECKQEKYGETQVRVDFINPFFEALGWDMSNKTRREITHEYSLDDQLTKIRPDYCFNAGGEGKTFFLEAKKPSVNLEKGHNPALQIRRYSWTANHSIGALTDFEELSVYYGRGIEPKSSDGPDVARLFYCNFREYADKWDEIHAMFSRQAVLDGSLERHAAAMKTKRGSQEVDAVFLNDIEAWRLLLAGHIASNNPALTQRELNALVQQTIDRIIFLRICEDRDIEPYGTLEKLLSSESVYQQLVRLFKSADSKYNSGLFYFKNDTRRSGAADTLALDLKIQDEPLKQIIQRLYFPHGPYAFSVMPADILGQVYERFLGKAIQVQPDRSVVVEEKPEVRKAGGVYYTPTYIVDYIVRSTVGKLVEGKAPDDISSMRVLDPACGSGSFLIRAYQYLLDWHLDWYLNNDPPKHIKCKPPELYQDSNDRWHLTIHERKRILLNNIYGVDIDSQAVEVSKLSLLLKVLEGENSQSMTRQLSLFKERALPDLGDNIKCGNSLIGRDFYSGQQSLITFDERLKINAFDWETEFADIMKAGGFDAVIGNPPYVFTRNEGFTELEKAYFCQHFLHQSVQLNTFGLFTEHVFRILRKSGSMGFITPNNWLTIDTFSPLRKFIISTTGDLSIINIMDRVFETANVDTAITLFSKISPNTLKVAEMQDKNVTVVHEVPLDLIKPPAYVIQISLLKNSKNQIVLDKIERHTYKLKELCTVSTGLKAYQTGKGKPKQTQREKESRIFHDTNQANKTYGRYLGGVDVRRYSLNWSGAYLSYGDWLAEPRKSVPFNGPRILVRQIPSKPPYLVHGIFTDEQFYNDINSMVIFSPASEYSLKYFLGLINSRLLSFWFLKIYDKLQRKIFPQFKVKELGSFPIRTINFSVAAEKAQHDQMVALVQKMLDLHKQLSTTHAQQEIEELKRDIAFTDKEIDRLVYELYDLTDDEIAIVEKK